MLTKTTTIADLEPDASYPYVGGSSNQPPQAGPSNLRDNSTYRPIGASQPTRGTEPVTPPHFSNSQPVGGTYQKTYYKTYFIPRGNGLPPLRHHVQCEPPSPGGTLKPVVKPLPIERFHFNSPTRLRRTPSPILPVPSFVLRPPFEPKGVWDTKGGPVVARDYAYADRNPIRPKEKKKKREKKKKVEPVDALQLLQNNKFFNPSGLPLPLVDNHGHILNGEEAFPHFVGPRMTPQPDNYANLTEEERNNIVLTPIVSPSGTLTYPDDPNYATARENAQNPGPLDLTQTTIGPMLERMANDLNRQMEDSDEEDDSGSPTPSPTTPRRSPPPLPTLSRPLHPLFGTGSSLTPIGSSASIEGSTTGDHDPPTEEMGAVHLTADEAGDAAHRYQLRQRRGAQAPVQVSQSGSALRRSPRSRNNTPSRSPPQARVKENARGETAPLTAPNHPHTTRPVSSIPRHPLPLKRTREEEGSSASLQGSPAVAQVVAPARFEDHNMAETSQRMTRSRARKARRLEGAGAE